MSASYTIIPIGFMLSNHSNGMIEIKGYSRRYSGKVSSIARKDTERIFEDVMKESQSMIAEKV